MPRSATPSIDAETPLAAPRRSRRKDARPGELLDAALDLFVEKGFAATRVEEVAARAGVSKGTLFLYFPSKVDLFKAVVRENIAGRFDEWRGALDQFQGPTAELVTIFMEQWWERVGDTRASGITKLVLSEAGTFPEIASFYQQEVMAPGHELVRRMLERGVRRGEFRDIDIDHTIHALIAPMVFMVMWKHSLAPCCTDIAIDPARFLRAQADLALRGLLVRPGAHP